jgi:hypothetical protein
MKNLIFTKINEFLDKSDYNKCLTDDEMLEMIKLSGESSGLDGVTIWIGSTLKSKYGKYIKVSNSTDSSSDCFIITIPNFDIVGKIEKKYVTIHRFNKIIDFINLNKDAISDICDEKIDAVEFLSRMKKV